MGARRRASGWAIPCVVVACVLGVIGVARVTGPARFDGAAELQRLRAAGGPGDPSAENGWPALVAIGKEIDQVAFRISRREEALDVAQIRAGGPEPEDWVRHLLVAPSWGDQSVRHQRLRREAIDAVVAAGIIERLVAASAAGRFEAVLQDPGKGSGDFDAVANPQRGRVWASFMALGAAAEDAVVRGEWERAAELARAWCAVADAMGRQPGAGSWNDAAQFERIIGMLVLRAVWEGGAESVPVCEALQDAWRGRATERLAFGLDGYRVELRVQVEKVTAKRGESGRGALEIALPGVGFDPSRARAEVDEAWQAALRMRGSSAQEIDRMRRAHRNDESNPITSYDSVGERTAEFFRMVQEARAVECRTAASRIVMGLAAYAARHGAPPRSLGMLVPEFLPSVPSDPFAADEAFRYIAGPTMRDVVLYSVGVDGDDDGGQRGDSWVSGFEWPGWAVDAVIWPPWDVGSDE